MKAQTCSVCGTPLLINVSRRDGRCDDHRITVEPTHRVATRNVYALRHSDNALVFIGRVHTGFATEIAQVVADHPTVDEARIYSEGDEPATSPPELIATRQPAPYTDIFDAANNVIDSWETGDLAEAVNIMREALEQAGLRDA